MYTSLNEEQIMIEQKQQKKMQIIRNRFVLLLCMHIFQLIVISFSLSYYRWYKLEINHEFIVWINLLYVYDK